MHGVNVTHRDRARSHVNEPPNFPPNTTALPKDTFTWITYFHVYLTA